MKTKQPKFTVGQVVAFDRTESFWKISGMSLRPTTWVYRFVGGSGLYEEHALRDLTRKEIGPRREQRRKKR